MRLQNTREAANCCLIERSRRHIFLLLVILFQHLYSNIEFRKYHRELTCSPISTFVFGFWSSPVESSFFSRSFKFRLIPLITFNPEITFYPWFDCIYKNVHNVKYLLILDKKKKPTAWPLVGALNQSSSVPFYYAVVRAFDVDFHTQLLMTQILFSAFSFCRVHCITLGEPA